MSMPSFPISTTKSARLPQMHTECKLQTDQQGTADWLDFPVVYDKAGWYA